MLTINSNNILNKLSHLVDFYRDFIQKLVLKTVPNKNLIKFKLKVTKTISVKLLKNKEIFSSKHFNFKKAEDHEKKIYKKSFFFKSRLNIFYLKLKKTSAFFDDTFVSTYLTTLEHSLKGINLYNSDKNLHVSRPLFESRYNLLRSRLLSNFHFLTRYKSIKHS